MRLPSIEVNGVACFKYVRLLLQVNHDPAAKNKHTFFSLMSGERGRAALARWNMGNHKCYSSVEVWRQKFAFDFRIGYAEAHAFVLPDKHALMIVSVEEESKDGDFENRGNGADFFYRGIRNAALDHANHTLAHSSATRKLRQTQSLFASKTPDLGANHFICRFVYSE